MLILALLGLILGLVTAGWFSSQIGKTHPMAGMMAFLILPPGLAYVLILFAKEIKRSLRG
ncbi:MAG: hypothetical protein DRG40_02875 [Deltaproteobacteria bacterium]|nr:MAG: hypothetical protein DRG40_02875 [Deltaproteobacteria bacterium]